GDTEAKWSRLAGWAIFSEREADLQLVAKLGIGTARGQLDPESVQAVRISCLLEVLREGGATAAQRLLVHIENTQQKGDALSRISEQVLATQLFRLGEQRKQALKHLEQAQELIDNLGPELSARVELRLLHARNVLLLLEPATKSEAHQRMRRQAEALVKDLYARGYHCLKELAAQLSSA